jgi:hypothetical protein
VQNPPVKSADAFHDYLDETTILDHDGWAYDLTQRVAQRLQAGDPADRRLEPVVTWIERATAFTLPGRYVYFSRSLLQCGLSEEAVAFVFAHELAHHRLGHLKEWLKEVPGAWIVGILARAAHSVVASPEKEAAADRWALERCVDVGYDRERCLEVFTALEKIALDAGAVDGVCLGRKIRRSSRASACAIPRAPRRRGSARCSPRRVTGSGSGRLVTRQCANAERPSRRSGSRGRTAALRSSISGEPSWPRRGHGGSRAGGVGIRGRFQSSNVR